jgi:hypothetical protein
MNFAGVLIAFSIFAAVFSCYCAARKVDHRVNLKGKRQIQTEHPHLYFVDPKQVDQLGQSQMHPVLFRIQGPDTDPWPKDTSPKHLGITVEEFEKCLPWIPYGNRILISNTGGFSPRLMKRLKRLHTNRDLFLVNEEAACGELFQRREA